ncbi:MAG TPA: C25 family cysteine peptidase [Pirellulaceae bacterium]|nr:C25 family cysteine peptidase [Pirellulaceae bacterium]
MAVCKRPLRCVILLLWAVWPASVWAEDGADTLVVCHPLFRAELQPWIAYRQQQGHRLLVIAPPSNAVALRAEIRRLASQHPITHLLLVGDAAAVSTAVPTDYHRAQVNIHFGSSPEIASDHSFSDLDDDGLPDLNVGRWPVRTADELRSVVEKVLAYESHNPESDWLRRINMIAGVGGFDPVIERSLEQLTRTFVTQLIPAEFDARMTYANWSSPYCPDPHRFQDAALDRFNEGCLFWVYIGHGSPRNLDYVYTPSGRHRILSCQDLDRLAAGGRHPIAVFLACHTGAFDDDDGCLAGNMLSHRQGPIAAICGTRVTMPYAMSLLSLEMLAEYFHGDAQTLGELVRRAKIRMVVPDVEGPLTETRKLIDAGASMISPRADLLEEERREHLYLFHLLGDPLLRIPRPKQVALTIDGMIAAGGTVTVSGTAPGPGRLRIEVCYERGRLTFRPKARREYDDSATERERYQREYEQSLSSVCVAKEIDISGAEFAVDLPIPETARGAAQVRVFWSDGKTYATGGVENR